MPKLDTHDVEAVTGAMYFIVGLGTEGGPASYRLSVTGVSTASWGNTDRIKADSGYSIGTIQVDLGKRGTWALGSTRETTLEPGERAYVDAIIEESAKFANEHGLNYATDKAKLRTELLTHGNGLEGRTILTFIDTGTRDSINAWASSEDGQKWIHRNIDYPQIRRVTESAMDLLDKYGGNIPEDHRLEAIAILAKTENQMPAKTKAFEKILKDGGDYDALLAGAEKIAGRFGYYAGPKAAQLTEQYEHAYQENAPALDRAQAMVSGPDFDPSSAAGDLDYQKGLRAIGQLAPAHALRLGSQGDEVASLQTTLTRLGITDSRGHPIRPDGDFGPSTREAVRAFQRAHGLKDDGLAGPKTLESLEEASRQRAASLADRGHPGHALFCQALEKVHLIDARFGRTPDELSSNLAGSLATAAQVQGLARIDHVVLGENATRAFAVQGQLDSPSRRFAGVDILHAVATPLARSSADFDALPQTTNAQSPAMAHQQSVAQPALQDVLR